MLTLEVFLLFLILIVALINIAFNFHVSNNERKELLDRIMSANYQDYVSGKVQLQEAANPTTTQTAFTPPVGFEEV